MHDVGISTYPQDLKEVFHITQRGVTFSWTKIECEPRNGALLGYEIKLYYDHKVRTERVAESVTTFTIQARSKRRLYFPKAISVAAVNEAGVGVHCPPVTIYQSG